ncbi:MAG TPA: leucyl aminopeptidase family protein [Rhizomicrobium sp.]|jgi:leucyl aminopeptidase|nr:leucyl aminopeptidase family protein [Rhizomicrobium sp.]
MHSSLVKSASSAIPLHATKAANLKQFLTELPKREAAWLKAASFSGREGELLLVPKPNGALGAAVLGLGKGTDPLASAAFSETLPDGQYKAGNVPAEIGGDLFALGWALGTYSFSRYTKKKTSKAKLAIPAGADAADVSRIADGVFLARDLVNTPSNDMGPEELATAARDLAKRHGAKFSVVVGDALLKANYPLVHAVGRASTRAPRLIDLRWGPPNAPKLTLVGKGVCFDTGGLDLKNSSGMFTMKKDMGGAACVLALAHMIMDAKLRVRLRVLIPAVENSVSGNAYRPGDVFRSRKGFTVEIGNTDAEGRLVLADALTEADSEKPDLLIDLATLTGAARAATGMELPPFFTDDEKLAADITAAGNSVADHLWRLPLWRGYEGALSSPIADLTNMPNYNLAGAITAALFLNRFVESAKSWIHIDIPAWNDRPKPGRRAGAEANSVRALYALLKMRYGAGALSGE